MSFKENIIIFNVLVFKIFFIQTDFFRIKIYFYSIENIFIQLFSVVKFGLTFVIEIV